MELEIEQQLTVHTDRERSKPLLPCKFPHLEHHEHSLPPSHWCLFSQRPCNHNYDVPENPWTRSESSQVLVASYVCQHVAADALTRESAHHQ
jgi:hypothetical protein